MGKNPFNMRIKNDDASQLLAFIMIYQIHMLSIKIIGLSATLN